ncbi:hypothetical protein [Klebsiella pneumoniae]|uniref:hypothetical protein n=1 Tax=Klebsiella pneumoniae TaxID=573 RepID=UPI0013966C4C|nr:hypothetical protein [Klebsiella pneumoniae]
MPQAFVTLFCEAIKAVLRTLSGVRFCSPGKRSATGGRYTPHSKKTRTFRDGVLFKRKNKKPGLSTGLSALFDAWQFPTLTWGDPTLLMLKELNFVMNYVFTLETWYSFFVRGR